MGYTARMILARILLAGTTRHGRIVAPRRVRFVFTVVAPR